MLAKGYLCCTYFLSISHERTVRVITCYYMLLRVITYYNTLLDANLK